MGYRFAADLTLVIHLLFIVFVLFGGLLSLWKSFWIRLHLPAMFWGLLTELSGWTCPLTPMENQFRRLASRHEYPESFIEHYLMPLIYPDGLTVSRQWLLGGVLLAINIIIYLIVFRIKNKHQVRLDD